MDNIVKEVGRVTRQAWTTAKLVGGVLDLVGGVQDLVGGVQELVGGVRDLVGGVQELVGECLTVSDRKSRGQTWFAQF
jgi:X-X-X-Leu-X-X-Gly heptad repeat protein